MKQEALSLPWQYADTAKVVSAIREKGIAWGEAHAYRLKARLHTIQPPEVRDELRQFIARFLAGEGE